MISAETLKIETTLLSIIAHHRSPEIIFAVIDTSVDAAGAIAPFLNIYGYKVSATVNLDEVIKVAIVNDDFGFIFDELKVIAEDAFNVNLSLFYPSWPDGLGAGTDSISTVIQSVINKHVEKFGSVKKLYLHFVDSFDFVKIIDIPQLD